MRAVMCVAVMLGGMLAVGPATGQSEQAPAVAPETHVLYLHSETGQDMWMNALEVDGAAGAICYKAPTSSEIGDLCPNPGESFAYVFDVAPALRHDLLLDAAGTIDFEIYWGGACCTAGTASYDLTLTSGDVTVASTSGTHNMNPAAVSTVCTNDGCVYNALKASIAPEVGRIAAADGLTLSLTGSGTWTHAAISTLAERGASAVTLPIIGTAGVGQNVTFVELETPEVNMSYENATTSVVQYNWTSPAEGAPALRIEAEVQNGSLQVEVVTSEAGANGTAGNGTAAGNTTAGGNGTAAGSATAGANGTTIFSWNGTGSLNETLELPACGAPDAPRPCAVAIRFGMDAFVGSYAVSAVPGTAGNGTAPATSGPAADGNGTLDSGDDQDTPMPLAAAVVAVGALAWIRRRR